MQTAGSAVNHAIDTRAARTVTNVVVTMLAFAGFEHGLFEALQGYQPTNGRFIEAIAPSMQWWEHGNEGAFTLIPNFLLSGLAAMAVSVLIVIWTVRHIDRKRGALVLLGLFVLLTLFGGGIGHLPFFLVTCAYASRIGKPLAFWRKLLGGSAGRALASAWPYALALAVFAWLAAIEIAVFGYVPGVTAADTLLVICWTLLLVALAGINAAYITAFADDIHAGDAPPA